MRAPTEEEPLILVRTATENIVLGMKLGASRAEFARREAEEARVAREAERAEEVEERRREEGREQSRVAAEARVAREAEADQRWQEMQSAREVFESYVETDMVRYLREEEKPGADATNYFKRELHNLETRKRLEPGGSIPLSRLVYLAYEANKSGKRRPDGRSSLSHVCRSFTGRAWTASGARTMPCRRTAGHSPSPTTSTCGSASRYHLTCTARI